MLGRIWPIDRLLRAPQLIVRGLGGFGKLSYISKILVNLQVWTLWAAINWDSVNTSSTLLNNAPIGSDFWARLNIRSCGKHCLICCFLGPKAVAPLICLRISFRIHLLHQCYVHSDRGCADRGAD